jgi:hypothetical protein
MKDATVSTMSESEYRSLPALNASRFKAFFRSPFHFFNQREVEETEAMRIGTAIHTAILEPEQYLSTIAFYPEADGRTTEGKAIKKAFEAGAVGKTILKADSKEIVERAVKAVTTHQEVRLILANPENRREQVLLTSLWEQDCKARLDLINVETGVIRDIKTCEDASPERFKYEVRDRLYWVQAGFYALVAEKVFGKPFGFEFIAVEKGDPSTCTIYDVDAKELEMWKHIVDCNLSHLKACTNTKAWTGYNSQTLGSLNLSQYLS